MQLGVLGPLLLRHGETDLVPKAPQAKQLLAFLMMNADSIVLATDCIDELWGPAPPKSAMSTLQTYIAQIRGNCRDGAGRSDILLTRNLGYQLLVDEGTSFDR